MGQKFPALPGQILPCHPAQDMQFRSQGFQQAKIETLHFFGVLPAFQHFPQDGGEGGEILAHAVEKMRRGEVHVVPGYDGVYGTISLVTPEERRSFQGQEAFWNPSRL